VTRAARPAVALLALAVLACGGGGRTASSGPPAAAPAAPGAVPPATHAAPARLAIPSLGVDAAVERVATDATGAMAVPADYRDAGWYSPGVVPGDPGDAVIDGHLDWAVAGRDVPAVFRRLASLRPGDELDVTTQDGEMLTFSVVASTRVPADADAGAYGLFDPAGPPRVTLVTCAGEWSAAQARYLERLAVTAELRPRPA
jgi:sortase (surface protein transpeptidase)